MDIKIYVPCHQRAYVPKIGMLVPIQVGAALNTEQFENMLHDNVGDSISEKNRMYCELTAQYWVWKNQVSDYVGFFHYRRYLSFSPVRLKEDGWGNIEYKERLDGKILAELNISGNKMESVISKYDVIVPRRRKLPNGNTVQSQYMQCEGQHKKDLKCMLEVVMEKYPEYTSSIGEYMQSNGAYECNMFIMRRSLFEQYAAWLFDILFETERRIGYSSYSQAELRVLGYLGERLFGIWYIHNRRENHWKTLELQKTLFQNTSVEEKIHIGDEVGIVMSSNDSFCPVLATSLCSMVRNSKAGRNYKVFVLNTDISGKNKAKIRKLQKPNFSIHFVSIGDKASSYDLHVDQHITVETYYRLFIPELFDCKKILYLDCDMVMNDDIGKLYDQEIGSHYVAACRDIDAMGTMKCRKELYQYIKHAVGCPLGTYFQAGVMLLNLEKIRDRFTTQELLDLAGRQKWRFWDQDVLNHAFKGSVTYLPQKWNVLMNWESNVDSRMRMIRQAPAKYYNEYCAARKKPSIIHYAGYQKPWNEVDCDMAEYFWKYARQTPFYEILIKRLIDGALKEAQRDAAALSNTASRNHQGVQVEGLEVPMDIDGVMLKIINKFNRRFPIGSRKRDWLRSVMRKIVR